MGNKKTPYLYCIWLQLIVIHFSHLHHSFASFIQNLLNTTTNKLAKFSTQNNGRRSELTEYIISNKKKTVHWETSFFSFENVTKTFTQDVSNFLRKSFFYFHNNYIRNMRSSQRERVYFYLYTFIFRRHSKFVEFNLAL